MKVILVYCDGKVVGVCSSFEVAEQSMRISYSRHSEPLVELARSFDSIEWNHGIAKLTHVMDHADHL